MEKQSKMDGIQEPGRPRPLIQPYYDNHDVGSPSIWLKQTESPLQPIRRAE
jgi:hypothetical protein